MKTIKPNLQVKNLYYSQLDAKSAEINNSLGSSSPQFKPKLIPKRVDTASQNLVQFSLKDIKSKAKNLIIQYVKNLLNIESFSVQLLNKIQAINAAGQLNQIFDLIFSIIVQNIEEKNRKSQIRLRQSPQRQEKDNKQLTFVIRSRQAKLLRLIKQDQLSSDRVSKGKTAKKLEQCQKVNQNLKKQLFSLKQEKQILEKRIASLVQEFQNRKSFYLAEIKKLTDIIKMSSFDVRNLVLQKTKQAKQLHTNRQQKNRDQKVMIENIQSEIQLNEQPHIRNYNSSRTPKMAQKKSYRQNVGSFNGYNTQIRILKNVSSIQNYQEEKADNYIP